MDCYNKYAGCAEGHFILSLHIRPILSASLMGVFSTTVIGAELKQTVNSNQLSLLKPALQIDSQSTMQLRNQSVPLSEAK